MTEVNNEDLLKELEAANQRRQKEENPPFLEIAVFILALYSALFHLIPWLWNQTLY